jgi:hypothetical protein
VGGSLDRLRGLDNWLLSSTNKWVSRIEKERLAKVPSDAPVTRHESASGSALTGSTHWFETVIESSDMKGYVHRTSVRVHRLNIHPHRRRSPTDTRLQRWHRTSRRALACIDRQALGQPFLHREAVIEPPPGTHAARYQMVYSRAKWLGNETLLSYSNARTP